MKSFDLWPQGRNAAACVAVLVSVGTIATAGSAQADNRNLSYLGMGYHSSKSKKIIKQAKHHQTCCRDECVDDDDDDDDDGYGSQSNNHNNGWYGGQWFAGWSSYWNR